MKINDIFYNKQHKRLEILMYIGDGNIMTKLFSDNNQLFHYLEFHNLINVSNYIKEKIK